MSRIKFSLSNQKAEVLVHVMVVSFIETFFLSCQHQSCPAHTYSWGYCKDCFDAHECVWILILSFLCHIKPKMLILKSKHFLLLPSKLWHQLFFSSELELGAGPLLPSLLGKAPQKEVFFLSIPTWSSFLGHVQASQGLGCRRAIIEVYCYDQYGFAVLLTSV